MAAKKDEPKGIRETTEFSFTEANSDNYHVKLRLNRILACRDTEFQRVEVIETAQWGKTLVMDGKTQSTLFDEYVYHEALVHPAMTSSPSFLPKKVFVGGGAEYATVREVLRYSSVEQVVMVDLDKQACELCKEHLPEWNQGCIQDPRLTVHFGDAKAFLEDCQEKFDLIILDVCDPIESGPAYVVYTQEFYKNAYNKLEDSGVLVTQAGACSLFNFEECFTAIHHTLDVCFDKVFPYSVSVPSFSGDWGFVVAMKCPAKDTAPLDEVAIDAVDNILKARGVDEVLKFYDGISHKRMFSLIKPIRRGLAAEKRVITVDNPVFMY